jgi:secondary thiamine-phosphate synthase enzyme
MTEFHVRTSKRTEAMNITDQVVNAARGQTGKILHVYTPHTTCAVAINEDADPDVMRDIMEALGRLVPAGHPYRHRKEFRCPYQGSPRRASVSVPLSGTCPRWEPGRASFSWNSTDRGSEG